MNEITMALGEIPFLTSREPVRVTRDVIYGEGGIDFTPGKGSGRHRALKLDVSMSPSGLRRIRAQRWCLPSAGHSIEDPKRPTNSVTMRE